MLLRWIRSLTVAAAWAVSAPGAAGFLPPGELRRVDVRTLSEADLDAQLARVIPNFDLGALSPLPAAPDSEVDLGRRLFNEKKLSGDSRTSCATCHIPSRGTGDGVALARGAHGRRLLRNTPALFNVGRPDYFKFFWDGRLTYDPVRQQIQSPTVELGYEHPLGGALLRELRLPVSAQVLFPLTNPDEMLASSSGSGPALPFEVWGGIERRLSLDAGYARARKISQVANALGAYISAEFSATDTPWDRYLRGDLHALSPRQKRGAWVFATKGRCLKCHNGPYLSNFTPQNAGFDQTGPEDLGAYAQTGLAIDRFAFRVPPLRNVGLTGPYGHSGAYATLRGVVEHYRHPRRAASPLIGEGITISDAEARDLVYFLEIGLTQLRR